jgi:hypothetical protein
MMIVTFSLIFLCMISHFGLKSLKKNIAFTITKSFSVVWNYTNWVYVKGGNDYGHLIKIFFKMFVDFSNIL